MNFLIETTNKIAHNTAKKAKRSKNNSFYRQIKTIYNNKKMTSKNSKRCTKE